MKKWFLFLVSLWMVFSALACQEVINSDVTVTTTNAAMNTTGDGSSESFLSTAINYRDKISEMVEENTVFSELSKKVSYATIEESNMYTKADFSNVYHNQKGMEVDINRGEFLQIYKDLLNEIIVELESEDIISLDVFVSINFVDYGDMNIYCGFANDDELIFKLDYQEDEMRVFTAFKLGYEEDDFFIKKMDYYQEAENISYHYSEFYENQSYFQLNFDDAANYIYHYISEVDLYEVQVHRSVDAIEAETPETGYNISWLDLDRQMRFLYSVSEDKTILSEYIDFFNDYSIVLSYMDSDTRDDNLRIIWNLLETDGWDYVTFLNTEADYDMHASVYKDDVSLFPDEIVRAYINEHHCLLSLDKYEVSKSGLTDSILSLGNYGLTFNLDTMSLEYLNTVRTSAVDTATHFEVFSGLDIFNNSFTDTFLDMMDEDLSYINTVIFIIA